MRIAVIGAFGRAWNDALDDEARNRSNFTSLRLANNDASAQARFNRHFGAFPVRALLSYGFLDNSQARQKSAS